jgi:hypothetical protein
VDPGSSNHAWVDFHPDNHALLVIDFQCAPLKSAFTGANTVFATFRPVVRQRDRTRSYDSSNVMYRFGQGIVWRTNPMAEISSRGSTALLRTTGVPLGANGLAFNRTGVVRRDRRRPANRIPISAWPERPKSSSTASLVPTD